MTIRSLSHRQVRPWLFATAAAGVVLVSGCSSAVPGAAVAARGTGSGGRRSVLVHGVFLDRIGYGCSLGTAHRSDHSHGLPDHRHRRVDLRGGHLESGVEGFGRHRQRHLDGGDDSYRRPAAE